MNPRRNLFGATTLEAQASSTMNIINSLVDADADFARADDFSDDDDVVNKLIELYEDALPFTKVEPQAISFCREDLLNQRNNETVEVCDSTTLNNLIKFNKVVLRFALTKQNEMRYGAEGTIGRKTPAHMQLICRDRNASRQNIRCHAAGNIMMKNNKLVCITNKSGDFRPTIQSLQFALAAMLRDGVAFDEQIIIEDHLYDKHDQYAGMYRYQVTLDFLKNALIELGHSLAPAPQVVVKSSDESVESKTKRKIGDNSSIGENDTLNPVKRRL